MLKKRPDWKILQHLSDTEVERKFADVQLNVGWLKDMVKQNQKGSPARAHYEAELFKEGKRLDELKAALSERGLIL